MERRYGCDGQGAYFFEECLHLRAVFSDDVDIVAAGFVNPVVGVLQGTELAECVGRKECLRDGVERYDDFGPVDHRRVEEAQAVGGAEGQCLAFGHGCGARGEVEPGEELIEHADGFGRCYDAQSGPAVHGEGYGS